MISGGSTFPLLLFFSKNIILEYFVYNIIAALISEDGMSFYVFWPYIFKTFYCVKFQ